MIGVGVSMLQPPVAALFSSLAFFIVLGLVAYRLLWGAPYLARLGVLPKSWRRWISDEPIDKKPN
jgi:hypothetical protein